jgi:nicotinate-nucleotide pyrophosphorylase (carboxylating)
MRDDSVGLALPAAAIRSAVETALAEDLGWGDVTSDLLVPAGLDASAVMVARQAGVVAGLEVARETFLAVDRSLELELLARDGAAVEAGAELLRVTGRARSILAGERVALNFVQRLSGTASLAARFVEAVRGTGARIVDTRKTTPGLRLLQKYAVRCGGAHNHRLHLGDAVLLKDNHRAAIAAAGETLAQAVGRARASLPHTVTIEIEVDTAAELEQALEAQPDAILLDNMAPEELRASVRRIRQARPGTRIEASGGVTLLTVRAIAETGVDLISVGALTHSAPAFDASLDFRIGGVAQ